jgi:hypothetical protein
MTNTQATPSNDFYHEFKNSKLPQISKELFKSPNFGKKSGLAKITDGFNTVADITNEEIL